MNKGPRRGTPEWDSWKAAGNFLRLHAEWEWMVTLSFSSPPVNSNQATARLREWLNSLAKRSGHYVKAAYAIEAHASGVLHIHVLVAFTPAISRPTIAEGDVLWSKRNGFAWIRVFDPVLGGEWYVAKGGNWDIMHGRPSKHLPGMPRVPMPCIPLPCIVP